jgi:ATP citrate (pro-S)-lyase
MQCATADPDGRKRALLIGGGIANFTDVAATFNGIIRALREKVCRTNQSWIPVAPLPLISLSAHSNIYFQESKLKASRMDLYVRRGGPNYQTGLAKMRKLGAEIGVPIEVLV